MSIEFWAAPRKWESVENVRVGDYIQVGKNYEKTIARVSKITPCFVFYKKLNEYWDESRPGIAEIRLPCQWKEEKFKKSSTESILIVSKEEVYYRIYLPSEGLYSICLK